MAAPVVAAPVVAAPVVAAPVKAAPVKAAPVVVAPPAPVVAAVVANPVVAAPVVAAPVMAAPAKPAGNGGMMDIMNLFAKVQTDAMAHTMKMNNKVKRMAKQDAFEKKVHKKDFHRHHTKFRGLVIGGHKDS